MLHDFDVNKVTFKKVKIKNVSYSFGGTLTVVDETKTDKETFIRFPIPLALARVFKEKYGVSQFVVPHEGCIMMYDGRVIALEKNQINERHTTNLAGDTVEWSTMMEKSFEKIQQRISYADWFFDGNYIYSFDTAVEHAVKAGEKLTDDGRFRIVSVEAIRTTYLGYLPDVSVETRQCLAYVAANGEYSVSTPVWKNLGGLGNSNLRKRNEEVEELGLTAQFDKVDGIMAVNLNFALAAGEELTEAFGYKSIEPLQLPLLMIKLKTVNLPKISKEVKQTFDVGMTFTQACAWLLGLQRQCETYEQMLAVRKLFKYLSTKGIFHKKVLQKLVKEDSTPVPLKTIDQAIEDAKQSLLYVHGVSHNEDDVVFAEAA